MRAKFAKVSIITLREQIETQIREAILHGELRPGERIVERRLASQFGASLTAIREAIIALESEGFILKKPNSSTFVMNLTFADAEKIFRIRRLLEGHAFEEAARNISKEQVRQLEQLHLEMLTAARANDLRGYVRKDLEWHKAVWQISGNEYLAANLERIVVPLFAFSSLRFSDRGTFDLLEDAQTHKPLVTALASGNPETARTQLLKGMDEWLEEVRTFVLESNGATDSASADPGSGQPAKKGRTQKSAAKKRPASTRARR
ncbi:MAG TPA: GntR family transcriptional regulator [Bryobacteraceae bacterium]|jgi:DNA-binding GntR family transcriptional regulator|nr:GntR family transcriptional regulator [Bryobacteraceae bacterium]